MKSLHCYDDILYHSFPIYLHTKRLSQHERAAQFAPFAALNGYEEEIEETERITAPWKARTEDEESLLDTQLMVLQDHLEEEPAVRVTYFVPDQQKQGGSYAMLEGTVRRIDLYEQCIVFKNGKKVELSTIVDMKSELFCCIVR